MRQEGKLNEDVLSKNGITYDLELTCFETLILEHAEAANVQQGLLDFENILTESSFVRCLIFKWWKRTLTSSMQNRLDETSQDLVSTQYPKSWIPPLQHHHRLSPELCERYNDQYQTARQDDKFNLALKVTMIARDIVAPKETRWASLIKDRLFGNLIGASPRSRRPKVPQGC